MATLLVFNKDNWMDVPSKDGPDLTGKENVTRKISEKNLSLEDETAALINLDMKWKQRDRMGDIIEVREDDSPRGGMEKFAFAILTVPGEKKDYLKYGEADEDRTVSMYPVLKHNRSYWLDIAGIPLNNKSEATIDRTQFETRIHRKK